MKAKGQDIIDFYREWPPGKDGYFDESSLHGEVKEGGPVHMANDYGGPGEVIDPSKTYDLWGCVCWQGRGDPPPAWSNDLATWFKRWRKAKTTATFVVEVPKDQAERFLQVTGEHGWRVR